MSNTISTCTYPHTSHDSSSLAPSPSSCTPLPPPILPSSTGPTRILLLRAFLLTIPGNILGSPSSVTLLRVRVRLKSSPLTPSNCWLGGKEGLLDRMLGLMVILDERRARVCGSVLSFVDVGDVGWCADMSVTEGDWLSRACLVGPRGSEDRAPGGRAEKWWGCWSAMLVADGWACIDAFGDPGCVAWKDFGVCGGALAVGWRLDIVRSLRLVWAARV